MSAPSMPGYGDSALKVGDRIKDNDPRMGNRILTISDLQDRHVYARSLYGSVVRILRRRIYTDGKPRKSGFSIVPGGAS